jgi:hypothetical protein
VSCPGVVRHVGTGMFAFQLQVKSPVLTIECHRSVIDDVPTRNEGGEGRAGDAAASAGPGVKR